MGGHPNSIWADEHAVALTKMLADGKSFAEIAASLNEQFNTTYSRNAACGKGFRLGVSAPQKMKAPRKKRKRDRERAPTIKPPPRIEIIRIRCTEIEPQNVTLLELDPDGCRYPAGDGPFVFCNHTQQLGFSYCPSHQALCHAKEPRLTAAERQIRRSRWMKLQKFRTSEGVSA